jgi:bifunctional non-homologous end joining protein LigD
MLLGSGAPAPGAAWVAEAKWDGMRALVDTGDGGAWRGWSRHHTPITGWFPELEQMARLVGGERVVLDGEVIALGVDGRPSFSGLQSRIGRDARRHETPSVQFVAFDVLWCSGVEVIDRPWEERRSMLEGLAGCGLVVSPVFEDAAAVAVGTRQMGLEGVVHKRRDAPYRPGRRSGAWRKAKHTVTSTLWVGGLAWTSRARRVPALLVGDRLDDGQLAYRGCVELATPTARRAELVDILTRAEIRISPFMHPPRHRHVVWVHPLLAVEVRHTLGRPGALREPILLGAVDVADHTDG